MNYSQRFITCCGMILLSGSAMSQNAYHLFEVKNNPDAKGINPRSLNIERDDVAEGSGWRALKWDTLSKGYSLEDSIPFAFQFNGSGVKKFRATKNGSVYFGSGVAVPMDFLISSLPDARIAPGSVVVGGVMAKGSNDRVLVKTVGQSPNRQHWIKFQSFTVGADTANKYGTFSYNAVVLEENGSSIHIVRMGWGSEYAWYADSVPVKLKQANGIVMGPFETYAVAELSDLLNEIPLQSKSFIDNSFVTFAVGKKKTLDASLSTGYGLRPAGTQYVKSGLGIDLAVNGIFTVHGNTPSTDYWLNVQVNGESPQAYPLTFVNFTDYRSALVSKNIQRDMQPGDRARIKVWLTLNGGGADDNASNDTLPMIFDYVAQVGSGVAKTPVLVEAYTATWCSQCPAANQILDSLQVKFSGKVIFVSHHINDNMNNANAPAALDSMPFIVIDRKTTIGDPKLYASALEAAISKANHSATVAVKDLVFNPKTRKVTGKLELQSLDALDKGGIRFGVMLKEKTVRGLGAGWDQRVEFNLTRDSQSIFFGKNKTLVGYYHNRVVWSTDGGKHGSQIAGLSGVMKSGETLSYTFGLTVPDTMLSLGMPTAADFGPTGAIYSRFKPADLSVVGYVASDFGMGISELKNLGVYGAELLAAAEQPIWDFAMGNDLLVQKEEILLYPNPASDRVRILSASAIKQVLVMDVMGRGVLTLGAVDELDLAEFSSGTYLVQVKTNTGVSTSRLVVQ